MDIYELIKNRISIRAYKTDPVAMEKVLKIIETSRWAPSWGNKQCWRFIIVDSKVEKNLIGKASGQSNIARACETAPYVVVLCANTKDSGVVAGKEYYMFDCALAMENFTLAAQSEGLSTCIVGYFDEKAVKGVLNVPEGVRVIAFSPLGCADEGAAVRSRKKQEEVVFHNYWGKGLVDS